MSNTLLTISMITNKALMVLENNLTFTKQINREYDDQFARSGAKIGDTVNVRKPVRYIGRTGPTLQVEGTTETYVPVTLTTQFGVDVSFTSKEMTLDLDDFSDRILQPAMATIANKIDYDGMQLYKDIYNVVGVPGTTPNTGLTYLQAGVKLDNSPTPRDGNRASVINALANAILVDAQKGLFNNTVDISEQYRSGNMGQGLGFKFSMDQNVGVQTIGTYVANVVGNAVTVTNAVSSGATVVTGGWTSGDVLNIGDVVTFAGVYAVNQQSRQTTGDLQQFVLTAQGVANGGGSMTLSVSPAIIFSGQYQTVTSTTGTIAAGAVLKTYGASAIQTPQNLSFHRDAFTLATADLLLPEGVHMRKRVTSKKLGISLRAVQAYDIVNDRLPLRFDVLYGWKTLRPELACRVAG